MSHESRELELHIDNTRRLYEQKMLIFKNLAKKKAKGEYRSDLGVKGLVHLTTAGAKDYGREHGTGNGLKMFSTSARREAAAEIEKEFHDWYETDWPSTEEGRKVAARFSKPASARQRYNAAVKNYGSTSPEARGLALELRKPVKARMPRAKKARVDPPRWEGNSDKLTSFGRRLAKKKRASTFGVLPPNPGSMRGARGTQDVGEVLRHFKKTGSSGAYCSKCRGPHVKGHRK